ncbi:hypothetical protein ABVK25_002730 [Lepraria finkii]|uniref:J domain-containing protein n=1 Tax=Lepraria finkii TaxID=1340010 RepID=A0ABR4BIY6_9LECA
MEDLSNDPPTDINPYEVLEIETTACSAEVKSSYKKLALRHHPDKVHPSARDTAHTKFQEIAFAYAILSDERRRKRYDTTGNTSESLDLDDDDFNWSDFFRAQWENAVTMEKLDEIKNTYQGSEEERSDVLKAYKERKGDLDYIFRHVMLSNPLDDEDRFRGYIDQAIEAGEVEAYHAYTHETAKKKKVRHQVAAKEAKEVEEDAKKKREDKGGENGRGGGEEGLAEMIQQRQKARAGTFLDALEAKYAPKKGGAKGQSGKKRKAEEPSEELFERNRGKTAKVSKSRVEEVSEDETSLDGEDTASDFDEEDEREMKPAKSKSAAKVNGRKSRLQKARKQKAKAKDDQDETSLDDENAASGFGEEGDEEVKLAKVKASEAKTRKRGKRGDSKKRKREKN